MKCATDFYTSALDGELADRTRKFTVLAERQGMRNHFRSAMHQVRNGFLFSVIYYDFSLHTVVFILFKFRK